MRGQWAKEKRLWEVLEAVAGVVVAAEGVAVGGVAIPSTSWSGVDRAPGSAGLGRNSG